MQHLSLSRAILICVALTIGGTGSRAADSTVSSKLPIAYIAHSGARVVSVLDVAHGAVIASIPVYGSAIAFTPNGSLAFVTVRGNREVALVDAQKHTVLSRLRVGDAPSFVAVSPDGSFTCVANQGSGDVSIIDVAERRKTGTIPAHVSSIAFTPDGSLAYANDSSSPWIWAIRPTSNSVIAKVPVGAGPATPQVSSDGSWIYVSNNGSGSVSVIARDSQTVVATVPVGSGPLAPALTPDGSHAYVPDNRSEEVSVIETTTRSVVATIFVGRWPESITVTPDATALYVLHGYDGTGNQDDCTVIDTSSNAVIGSIPLEVGPFRMAAAPGNFAVITNLGSNEVSVVDTVAHIVLATAAVGAWPSIVAVRP